MLIWKLYCRLILCSHSSLQREQHLLLHWLLHIGDTWYTLTGRRLQTYFVPNDCSDCDQPLICSVVFWKSSLKILVFSPVKYQSEATSSQIHHLQVRILHDKRIPRGGKSYWFSVIAFSSTKLAFQSWQDSQIPEMWIHDVSMVKINVKICAKHQPS